MKKNFWLTIGVALITSGLLVRADAPPAPDQAKTSPPPAAKTAKKKVVAKPAKAAKAPVEKKTAAAMEKPIVLAPGAATVSGNNVNVRGKASFGGEVFTKLKSGDAVTVIEQVIVEKPKAGEPSQWAKIAYPAGAHVWVHSSYVDANKTVKPKKLNVRTGPGENYSVVGLIEHGTAVKEISAKGNWLEIEAPASAFAYVAAGYLHQAPSAATVPPIVSIAPPEPATTNTVPPPPVVATTTPPVPAPNPATEPAPVPVPDATNAAAPPAVIEEIEVPRFVAHEGIVRGTVSIQAPTRFGLYSAENNKLINYLYSPTARLEMSRYYNLHVIVSGQEGLDERWKNTPVLTIQRIQVIEGAPVNPIPPRKPAPVTHKGQ